MGTAILHEDLEASVHDLRRSLRALIVSADADPGRPQEIHRRFAVDRGLCWKISRIVKAKAATDALAYLPGSGAFAIFVDAIERGGGSAEELRRVREAIREVAKNVERHVGDRPTLELVLDSAKGEREGLIVSRKLAFRGNSGIWGVQAYARTHLVAIAPNRDDPDGLDVATVGGWIDFRRLRPDARWRVFNRRTSTLGVPPPVTPIDPNEPSDGAMLIGQFCENVPPLIMHQEVEFTRCEIGPAPAGAAGAFTLFSGFLGRGIGSRWASEWDSEAKFAAHILAPVEHLTFDLLVHRSFPFLRDVSFQLSSAAFNDGSEPKDYMRLPIVAEREDLGSPPVLAGAYTPRCAELVDYVMNQSGWKLADFIGLRFFMDYPPFPSLAVIQFPLEERVRKTKTRAAKRKS